MDPQLREVIGDILGLDPSEVTAELSRETADNWDSLNHLRIITAVETTFSITLTMAEIEASTSVAALSELVTAKTAPG
jgi:acyl carrier protein